jgi:hypothetical protein
MMENFMYYTPTLYDQYLPVNTLNTSHNFYRLSPKKNFTTEDALWIGKYLKIPFDKFDVEQFRIGLNVELEHGTINPFTNITNDDPILTGKITLAHLNEFPDYYTRLVKMEREADEYWGNKD